MSFYNVAPAPFNADKLDAIVKLDSIGMLDRKTAIALLGGNPIEHKPTVITRNAEIRPTAGELRHAASMRKVRTAKVVTTKVPKLAPATPVATIAEPRKALNHAGVLMLADAGTASKGQIKRLTDKGVKNAHRLSMVDASNMWAALKAAA
jgi:hypothetical protein